MNHPPIEQLIPHRHPLRLIDEVVSSEENGICCAASVAPGNVFLRGGKARGVLCIEYMAQAVAAFSGLSRSGDGPPRIGYLIAATRLTLAVDSLYAGDVLRIVAKRVWGDDALGKFECEVSRDGATIATGSLSVYLPPEQTRARDGTA